VVNGTLRFDVRLLVELVKREDLVLLCHGLQDLNCHSPEFPLRYTKVNIYVTICVREGELLRIAPEKFPTLSLTPSLTSLIPGTNLYPT
jgi:hypothetical protein